MKRFFLDFETTGLNPITCAIHQASGIIEINNEIVEIFDLFVKPFEGAEINQEALDVGNLSLETIMNYELSDNGLYRRINSILQKYCNKFDKKDKFFLIGYNINFDKEFLSNLFLRNNDNYLFSNIWGNTIDVMNSASEYLEDVRHTMTNFKLITVAKQFNIELDEEKLHNSFYDIEITRKLFYIIREYNENGKQNISNSTNIKELFLNHINSSNNKSNNKSNKISEQNSEIVLKNTLFDFGKYIDKTVEYVLDNNPGYIIWIQKNNIKNIQFCEEIIEIAEYNISKLPKSDI